MGNIFLLRIKIKVSLVFFLEKKRSTEVSPGWWYPGPYSYSLGLQYVRDAAIEKKLIREVSATIQQGDHPCGVSPKIAQQIL